MSMEDLELILNKLKRIPKLFRISLNHYNEPFMDPHIVDRIKMIADKQVSRWVILFTNGSMIRTEQLSALYPYRRMLDFCINIPTAVSAERYRELQGKNNFDKVERNIDELLTKGFLVRLDVQINEYTTREDLKSIQKRYKRRVRWIEKNRSGNRNNLVTTTKINHRGRIIGCRVKRHTNYLHIGVTGKVFLCAEDYYQNFELGNLMKQSLEEILHSPTRLSYLDYISGRKEAPERFLCRSCRNAIIEGQPSADKLGIGKLRQAAHQLNVFYQNKKHEWRHF